MVSVNCNLVTGSTNNQFTMDTKTIVTVATVAAAAVGVGYLLGTRNEAKKHWSTEPKICATILDHVGNTPLVRINKIGKGLLLLLFCLPYICWTMLPCVSTWPRYPCIEVPVPLHSIFFLPTLSFFANFWIFSLPPFFPTRPVVFLFRHCRGCRVWNFSQVWIFQCGWFRQR